MGKSVHLRKSAIFILLFILIVLFLLLHNCMNTHMSPSGGLIYEDDTGKYELNEETPLGDSYKGRIVFPGFSKKTIKYDKNQMMNLQNPRSNTVDFVYTILYEDKTIYISDKIKPGGMEKWNLRNHFTDKGTYEITILITPYDDTGTEKNGFKQVFIFEIV